jgi:hypothetical protein
MDRSLRHLLTALGPAAVAVAVVEIEEAGSQRCDGEEGFRAGPLLRQKQRRMLRFVASQAVRQRERERAGMEGRLLSLALA